MCVQRNGAWCFFFSVEEEEEEGKKKERGDTDVCVSCRANEIHALSEPIDVYRYGLLNMLFFTW